VDIRVINLERAPDRKRHSEAQLRAAGLEAEFFSGVDGRTLDFDEFAPFLRANPFAFRPLSRGEIGCFASHYRLWQECAARGRPMLILEDDFLFQGNIRDLTTILPGLLQQYSFLRLAGAHPCKGKILGPVAEGLSVVRLDEGPFGTHAYAVSPAAAARLVRHSRVWSRPVDVYIDAFWVHGLLPLAVQPYPVGRADFSSTVGDAGQLDRSHSRRRRLAQRRVARLSRKVFRRLQAFRRAMFKLRPAWNQP
jgi:glycosyl transferase family 25